MTVVTLIVTGDVEKLALGESLGVCFPTVTFRVEKVASITSTPISDPPTERSLREGQPAWRLVERLWKAVTTAAKPGEPESNFAFALDDVELCNLPPHGEPRRITALVHAAVERFLLQRFASDAARQRHREILRERCSFHLLSPMVEAYFFGERDALTRAGVPRGRAVLRVSGDLEEFRASDPSYAAPVALAWQEQRERRRRGGLPLDPDRHPKDYLDFLRDPTALTYDETRDGVAALKSLRWGALTTVATEVCHLRSFLEDLADAVGLSSPLGAAQCSAATYPARNVDRRTLVLRNL